MDSQPAQDPLVHVWEIFFARAWSSFLVSFLFLRVLDTYMDGYLCILTTCSWGPARGSGSGSGSESGMSSNPNGSSSALT